MAEATRHSPFPTVTGSEVGTWPSQANERRNTRAVWISQEELLFCWDNVAQWYEVKICRMSILHHMERSWVYGDSTGGEDNTWSLRVIETPWNAEWKV